ncbi:hypothetical protein ATJ88_0279 [Isoptericola jiangsuensis]|uniref:Uncharacterized protein n=1 Tax=Isoptericola jiangsuensis TaxID=548579 RepID=A0A2A9ER72_9MICO|nr:hypothetical protein [Isoptericola jiangsuensis]PFG41637.1 hypothetical protein ATJ88_0279 [Isoptericola jiangsuensis]
MTADADLAPLAGSPPGLATLAGAASRAAGALGGTRADLARLDEALAGHRSAAVEAARERLARLGADVALCADVLRTAAGVLSRRSTGLSTEQDDAARALSARDDALARLARAEADEAAALRGDPAVALADVAQRAWDARVRAEQARGDVAAAERAWRTARDAKDTASRQAAPLLDGLADARAVAVSAAHGVGAGDHATAWRRGTDLAADVPGTFTGGPEARDAARTDLFDALVAAQGDPALWTAFWDAVDPAALSTALGAAPPPAVTDALAGGLGVWAASADRRERYRMGDGLVAGVGTGTDAHDRAAGLGELLGAARLPAAVWAGAADALVARGTAAGPDDVDAADLAPVVVAVATGLSAHPRAALDHVAPSDPDALLDRSRFWFGRTPPDGWPDGGVAVTGLLAAAVAVGARPGADVPTQERAARAVSAATTELVGDRGLLTVGRRNGPVDPVARAAVVELYRPYVASFGENVELADEEASATPGTLLPRVWVDEAGDGTIGPGVDLPWPVVQPGLDAFALRDVVTATSEGSADADRWLHLLDGYVADSAEVATGSGLDGEDRKTVVTNALDDVSFVAGSIQSPVIGAAEAVDGRRGTVAAATSVGLGVATAPAAAPVSLAATILGAILPGLVPDTVSPAREEVLRTEPLVRERFAEPLYRAVVDQDVARGATPEAAAADNQALHPHGPELSGGFGKNYDLGSRLGRQLGEST